MMELRVRPMRKLVALTALAVAGFALLVAAGVAISELARQMEQAQAAEIAARPATPAPVLEQVRLFAVTASSASLRIVTDVSSTVTVTYQTKGRPAVVARGGSGLVHTIALSGLAPGSVYDYRVDAVGDFANPGLVRQAWQFHTPAERQRTCAFGVIGDTQGDFSDVVQSLSAQDLDIVVTVGDNVEMEYAAKTAESVRGMWSAYYRQMISLTARYPLYVTLGNHDVVWQRRPLVWEAFAAEVAPTLPVSSTYYSFDCGGAHFVVLDSETVTATVNGPQWDWAIKDLAASTAPLKIVVAHRPFVGGDNTPKLYAEDGDARIGMGGWGIIGGRDPFARGMMAAKGVKLAIAGHRHVYNRYVRDGITYLINPTAAVGKALSANPPGPSFLEAYSNEGGDSGTISHAIAAVGFMVGRLADGALTMTAMDRFGVVIDTYRMDLK